MNRFFKVVQAVVWFFFISSGLSASENLSGSMQSCAKQADNKMRLACFDKLAQTLSIVDLPEKNSPQEMSEPAEKEMPHIPVLESKAQRFGLPDKVETQNVLEKIVGVIAKLDKDPYGKLYVTTEAGQVWQQIDSTRMRLRKADSIFIESAALGSYFLAKEGFNKRMRVKRVK